MRSSWALALALEVTLGRGGDERVGITLSYVVSSDERVDEVLAEAGQQPYAE